MSDDLPTTDPQTAIIGADKMSYEEAMAELENIVTRLERGDVALDQSIALYERGQSLKHRCAALLRDAEARIEKMTLNASGQPVGVTPLDAD